MRRSQFQRESWKEMEMDPSFVSELFDHRLWREVGVASLRETELYQLLENSWQQGTCSVCLPWPYGNASLHMHYIVFLHFGVKSSCILVLLLNFSLWYYPFDSCVGHVIIESPQLGTHSWFLCTSNLFFKFHCYTVLIHVLE